MVSIPVDHLVTHTKLFFTHSDAVAQYLKSIGPGTLFSYFGVLKLQQDEFQLPIFLSSRVTPLLLILYTGFLCKILFEEKVFRFKKKGKIILSNPQKRTYIGILF